MAKYKEEVNLDFSREESVEGLTLQEDWKLNRDNLFAPLRRKWKREFDRMPENKRPVETSEEYVQYKFNTHQTKILRMVDAKGYLDSFMDSGAISITLTGRPRPASSLISKIDARRRGRTAPLYGYGPHNTELIMNGGVDLRSNNHWLKARTIRWLRTYVYCQDHGMNFYNIRQWVEASKTQDEQQGNRSIWDVLADTKGK